MVGARIDEPPVGDSRKEGLDGACAGPHRAIMVLPKCVRGLLLAAVCLPLGGLPGGAVAGAAAESAPRAVGITLDFWSGGIRMMRQEVSLHLRGNGYRLAVDTETLGLLDLLLRFSQSALSQGAFTADGLRPERFMAQSSGRFGERTVSMTFGADGLPRARLLPPPDEAERDTVTAEHVRGSLDPLAAALSAAIGTAEPCTGSLPIFDGRRRYDLRMTSLGKADLAPSSYSAYAGPALHCRFAIEPVAGFSREWRREGEPPPPPSELWLAWLADSALLVPVRLETQTRFGWVIGHLVEAKLDSVQILAAASRR